MYYYNAISLFLLHQVECYVFFSFCHYYIRIIY